MKFDGFGCVCFKNLVTNCEDATKGAEGADHEISVYTGEGCTFLQVVKFIHEGQGGATPTKSPKEGFPRERNRGTVLGAGKTLALYQKPKFIPNMLEGFRKDPRDPAYTDTHSV